MGDDAQGGDLVKDAAEGLLEGVRVKRCETLVEDTQVSTLEKRPGDVETTPFTMGKLPASLRRPSVAVQLACGRGDPQDRACGKGLRPAVNLQAVPASGVP